MKRLLLGACAALLALSTLPATAQDWPTKQVKLIVPFAAGSTPVVVGRLLTDYLQTKTGQTFVVENRPGASGNTGTDVVAKSDPDGYTLGMSILGPLGINAILFGKLPYDPAKDLSFITMLVTQPNALAVNASLPVNNAQELLKLIKDNPGKYNFGSIGNGSLSHLSMEAMVLMAGSKMVHIPYPGSPAAMTALMRNDVQVASLPAIAVTPQLGSGQIKLLAISSEERSKLLPDVPTLKESGIDLVGDAWSGLVAPANTPAPIIEKIRAAFTEALQSPAIREKIAPQLTEAIPTTPAQFRARVDADIKRWGPVIQAANITVN